jgi:hypothetical protein
VKQLTKREEIATRVACALLQTIPEYAEIDSVAIARDSMKITNTIIAECQKSDALEVDRG